MIPGIPYDAEVEYLHFPSGSYIDTGWSGFVTNEVIVTAHLRITRYNEAYDTYFGNFGTDTRYAFLLRRNNQTNQLTAYFSWNDYYNFNHAIGTFDEFKFASGNLLLNGAAISSGHGGFMLTQSVIIGATRANGSIMFSASEFDLAAFSGVDSHGTLVRDFIPVRFTNELGVSEGAMYDRVTRKLFRNQGTGSFVVGPDVAKPVMGLHFMKPHYVAKDYVQDGLVAMWDGIESHKGAQWTNIIADSPVGDFTVPLEDGVVDIVENGYRFTSASAIHGPRAHHSISGWNGMTIEVATGGMVPTTSNTYNISFGFNLFSNMYARSYWRAEALLADATTYSNGFGSLTGKKTFGAYWESTPQGLNAASYADGIIVKSHTFTTQTITPNPNYDLYLMSYFSGSNPYQTSYSGIVYGCRVYNRALTAAEIAHNYAVDKVRFNLPEVA